MSKLDRLGPDAPDVLANIKSLAVLDVEIIVLQLGKLVAGRQVGADDAGGGCGMERDLLVERTPGRIAACPSERQSARQASQIEP